MNLYYGLKCKSEIVHAAERAIDVFGGDNNILRLMIGTACTETDCGTFKDAHPTKIGVSVVQFDEIRFNDVKRRTRPRNIAKFEARYNIVFSDLKLSDIAYNTDLAMAMCRLAYILIPDLVPSDLKGQARYWKDYWNSHAKNAKGSVESYLEDWENHKPFMFIL